MSFRLSLLSFIALLAVGYASARAQITPIAPSYQYSAQTNQQVRRQGSVVASGITWACQGQVCTTRGPWPRPGVEACRALAAEVGVISSYGRVGAMLSASELATCNAARVTVAPGVVTPPLVRAPAITTRSGTPGLTLRTDGPVTINTPEVSFVGGTMVDTSDRLAPAVAINTPEIAFVGGAAVDVSDRAAPPVTITTPEIAFVGR